MKILLTNDFSNSMAQKPKDEINALIDSVDKLNGLTKTKILSLDEVISLSAPEEKRKIYAYNISNNYYVVFVFTNKNDMVLVDRIQLNNGSIVSLTYPDITASEAI